MQVDGFHFQKSLWSQALSFQQVGNSVVNPVVPLNTPAKIFSQIVLVTKGKLHFLLKSCVLFRHIGL